MKKTFLLLLMLPFMCNILFSQQKEKAEKLVDEGVAYHDKGDYDGAIAKYDKALELDKDNLLALAEKAYTLLTQLKYDETIKYCKKAIETHAGENSLKTVYVTYGNACDGLKKTDESIAVYDEGIKSFPDFYYLYFNKGVTLSSVKKYDDAILCFQKSVQLNPKHASSHNAIARLTNIDKKRIPALLAYCRFLTLEPESNRAKENLGSMQTIMKGNVEKTGKKSVTINISSDALSDTSADGKPKEDNFNQTELILSMAAAMDYDKKFKNQTEVEQFSRKLEMICASLAETKKNTGGFYWTYYVPYFTEMKAQNYIETFAHIAFASSEDPKVAKWLKANKSEVQKFFEWSKSFTWAAN